MEGIKTSLRNWVGWLLLFPPCRNVFTILRECRPVLDSGVHYPIPSHPFPLRYPVNVSYKENIMEETRTARTGSQRVKDWRLRNLRKVFRVEILLSADAGR